MRYRSGKAFNRPSGTFFIFSTLSHSGVATKAPVCDVCLKSNVLCQDCERKLAEGKISQLDVEASRILYKLAQKHHGLGEISFKRALREGGLTILAIVQDKVSPTIEQEGRLAQEVSKHLKTKIRVVKENANVRELAREILMPARVKGINVLFKRRGEEYRVRITRADLMLLPASIDVLQALLTKITNKKIKLVFE